MAIKTEPITVPRVEQEKILLSWTAKARPFKEKDFQSRQVLIVLGVLISMVLVFAGEWMLLAVLAAGAFYYYATNFVPPETVEYQITNLGLRAFGRFFGWWEFRRWWWTEKWTTKLIGLDLQTGVMGQMFVPVEKVKTEEVEKIISSYVMFEKPKETTLDKASKWMVEKFPLESKI